jgi:hypothetical protein
MDMAKTCIVCGGAAGSGEHVFPASLGGRRVNRGIYCSTHDNGYSDLVFELANQLDVFNARLGVRPDHSADVKSARGHELESGEEIALSAKDSRFVNPRILSQERQGDGVRVDLSFSDQESVKRWVSAQEAMGHTVALEGSLEPTTYFLGSVRYSRQFGGPNGLGAVAYVTQTFLAQEFPEVARSQAVKDFIAYTQASAESVRKYSAPNADAGDQAAAVAAAAPIWWDFDSQPDQTPNKFDFGHRVTVGVDSVDGLIFGRMSFFSSLHFSMIFGVAPNVISSKSITIDIDPLAEHPPEDIVKNPSDDAIARVTRPVSKTAGLAKAISNDKASRMFDNLLRRMSDFSLSKTAGEMSAELAIALNTTPSDVAAGLAAIIEPRAQRVLNLTRWVVDDFKMSSHGLSLRRSWPKLDALIELDAAAANGLSASATASLQVAKDALLAAMIKDHGDGRLTKRRFAELISGTPGAAIIAAAILPQFLLSLHAAS